MNRVALVIGNSEYLNIGKLNNPKNDANDIASMDTVATDCILKY